MSFSVYCLSSIKCVYGQGHWHDRLIKFSYRRYKRSWGRASKNLTFVNVPNNRSANLINFLGKKITYNLLLKPTRLLISEIFPLKPDFHIHKWEKNPSYLHGLIKTYTFINFWEICHLQSTPLNGPTRLFGRSEYLSWTIWSCRW